MSTPGGALEGRVAVVTGSTRGIGRAIAETLSARGAVVVVNSRDHGTRDAALREGGDRQHRLGDAFTTPPRRVSYVAAKAGLVAITKVMAGEWAPAIRVNAVAPGYFAPDLVAELVDRGVIDSAAIEQRSPFGRLGRPKEVARASDAPQPKLPSVWLNLVLPGQIGLAP